MQNRALRIVSGLGGVVAILAITPSIVGAQEVYEPTTQDILNNIWVFMAGVLVFFMQAGFALVEAGLTRAKNVVNIFAKNIADAIVGVLAFFACGFAFAYGGDGNDIIGFGGFFLSGGDAFGIAEEGALSLSTRLLLPVGVRRHGGHDRLGRDGRAHEVHVVPDVLGRDVCGDLPDRRALDLGRRPHRPNPGTATPSSPTSPAPASST